MAASGNICAATPCPPPASPPACPIDDSLPFPRRRQTRLVPSSPAALPWSPHCHGHGHGHCHCHCRYHDHYRVHYTPTTRPLHAHHRRHYTRPPPISCSPHASASVRRASLGPVPARPPGDRPQGVCENLFVRLFLPGSASWFEAGGHVHTHYPRRLQNLLCRSLLTDAHALAHALALALARPRPPLGRQGPLACMSLYYFLLRCLVASHLVACKHWAPVVLSRQLLLGPAWRFANYRLPMD